MTYQQLKPAAHLANFIQCFWASETGDQDLAQTILPDGCFDLILDIETEQITQIKLTGIWSIPIHVSSRAHQRRFAVRFRPLAAELLAGIDLAQLLNTAMILPLAFWGLDRLAIVDFDTFCAHVDQHLSTVIAQQRPVADKKIRLFELISQQECFNVNEIAERIGWQRRQINRYFKGQLGLSLKIYLNILRCHAAYQAIAQKNPSPDHTYYDQAHFIREIKRFTGVSPKALQKNENDRFVQLSTQRES